jgi:hypothetical protein
MSRGVGKVQRQILELLAALTGDPVTTKTAVAWLSKTNDRQVSDRQVRAAFYALEDRGLVELRVQHNPFGRAAICAWLPGAMATFDAAMGAVVPGARPARPPKPEPRTLAGECGRLAQAAVAYADADPDDAIDAFSRLVAVALDFKPPLDHLGREDS